MVHKMRLLKSLMSDTKFTPSRPIICQFNYVIKVSNEVIAPCPEIGLQHGNEVGLMPSSSSSHNTHSVHSKLKSHVCRCVVLAAQYMPEHFPACSGYSFAERGSATALVQRSI